MPAVELLPKVWCEETGRFRRPWGGYRKRRPNQVELQTWFRDSDREYGMAVLAGKISGNLEIIDLDNSNVVGPWLKLVKKRAPGLLDRLVLVKTPRPGLHVYYRCATIGSNQILAQVLDPEKDNNKPKTIIEVKGEGGCCVAPPSPAGCHPMGRCYHFVEGKDLTMIPTITSEERAILLDCGRALNCWQAPKRTPSVSRPRGATSARFLRPGDDFNHRASWSEILQPHGWTLISQGSDGSEQWRRPGKATGVSATTNFGGSDLLYVFSSNAPPFEGGRAYTKFSAFALLEHGGEFHAAASALRGKGFGVPQGRYSSIAKPFQRYGSYPVRSRGSSE